MRKRLRLLARLAYITAGFAVLSLAERVGLYRPRPMTDGEREFRWFARGRKGPRPDVGGDGVPNLDPAHLDRAGNYVWPQDRGER